MNGPGVFLTAEWRNLLMLNYALDASSIHRLRPHVPAGTELDEFAGRSYLSLIGFEFLRTRVRGLAIPFHRSFEEVNLRFYVRCGTRRGVVFLRELVPRLAIAQVARFCYGENYRSVPMSHRISSHPESGRIEAEFAWGRARERCSMSIETRGAAFLPAEGSLAQFITEHYWGYAAQRAGSSLQYEVKHPRWEVREAARAEFTGDGARYYGPEFAKLLVRPPDSAFFVEGSPVSVCDGERIGLDSSAGHRSSSDHPDGLEPNFDQLRPSGDREPGRP